MSNKVHDISSAPKDAPRNDSEVVEEETTPGLWSRTKNALTSPKVKMLFVGVGIGAATTAGAIALAKNASEEEDDGNGNPVDIP